jgi:hypothetical protein
MPVLPARRLPGMLRELLAVLGAERVADRPIKPGSASTLSPDDY